MMPPFYKMEIRFYTYQDFRYLQMNSKTSTGERVTREECDARIKEAKALKLANFMQEHGYFFCEDCGTNEHGNYIDCSHTIGVGKAKQIGKTELCWSIENIKLRCRNCHRKLDNL